MGQKDKWNSNVTDHWKSPLSPPSVRGRVLATGFCSDSGRRYLGTHILITHTNSTKVNQHKIWKGSSANWSPSFILIHLHHPISPSLTLQPLYFNYYSVIINKTPEFLRIPCVVGRGRELNVSSGVP